ncbi:phosphotransferase enzyme family protein [Pedobacter sp.]|uniref:phosphotransferase enzyme family protein n=1 Tax=Pedobacter sp. TaxID=1411316 RepID=UPI003BAD82F3
MKDFFPAQYSTLSASALNKHIANSYNLTGFNCRLLIRNVSDTYILENGTEKFIFKIYRDSHRKLNEIEDEVRLLNILKNEGHSISFPIEDTSGHFIQQFNAIEGTRNGVLFSYAEGKVIHDLNQEQLKNIGVSIAKIHQTTSQINLKNRHEFNFQTTLFEPLESLKPHLIDMPEEFSYLQEIAAKVVNKFKAFDTENFSIGICHYDFFPKNFHFEEAGKITFFDFDFAGKGYLINDLMTFLNHFFFHTLNNLTTIEQAEKDFNLFLDAYQSVKKLSDDEIKAIPYLGITFHIFFLKFFYDNYDDWSNAFLTPRYTKRRIDLIKKWVEMYCDFSS